MKKLITIMAAAASALFAFGGNDPGFISGTSVEAYTGALRTDKNDAGTEAASTYWFLQGDENADLLVTNYESGVTLPPRPAKFDGDTNNNFLKIDTTGRLYRSIEVNSTGTFTPSSIGDGIYLDTLVQFTAADDQFKADAITAGDKIAISYVEHESEGENDPSYTNFVVRAAYVDAANSTIVATNYFLTFPDHPANEVQFNKDAWHRLTVRAISNVGNTYAPVGFVVYVDGTNLVYKASVSGGSVAAGDEDYVGSLNSVVKTYLYNSEAHSLLPSLMTSDDIGYDALAAVAFNGNGCVDDISFTTEKPTMGEDPFLPVEGMTVTIAWDANVTNYTVVAGETILINEAVSGAGSTNLLLAAEVTAITVTATYAENYEPGKWTVTGEGASISGSTFTVAPGAQLNIVSIYPYFQVGDAFYQEFDGEDGALAAAIAGSGVIKLNKDYPHDIALTDGTVTIDLAGKTITGDATAAIVNGGADLIITNSTAQIGHIVNPSGDDTFAILIGDGTTSIYGGWVDGMIEFDTSYLPQDLLFLYGGYYNDASTTDPASFYRNDCARDVVSYVGDPAYYFQVGGSTPEPPAPTVVQIPTAALNLVYTGNQQTGVDAGEGYTLSGTYAATDAGNYIATATLNQDCVWSDETTAPKEINWSIAADTSATVDVVLTDYEEEYTAQLAFPTASATIGGDAVVGTAVWSPDTITEPAAGATNTYTATFTVTSGNYAGSTGTAEFKVFKAAAVEDWPADPADVSGETAAAAFGISGDLANADAGVLATWAKANSVDYSDRTTAILTDAFLLNCANTQEAVDAAKANFKVTAITVVGDTVTITPADAADYGNGKIVIEGASAITSPMSWHAKTTGDHFFRATLVVKPVTP